MARQQYLSSAPALRPTHRSSGMVASPELSLGHFRPRESCDSNFTPASAL
ncbi:hypothetical protein HPP92_015322 [Vanilla planifolia]|uniref:Uncharacterized protein n=1 Tax=Vanilla planifolia TaxID=51239 RepID=A0A835QHM6_VANPL|nr:hypothetical protein HPP92_015322 [Vanilla planifolia]